MKRKLALAAMLGGSVTFLVSLYFDWLNRWQCVPHSFCFAMLRPEPNASSSGFGEIAAVLAMALAVGAIAAAVDPKRAQRLPLGLTALAFGIFVLLSISALWTSAIPEGAGQDIRIGLGPGAYIGLAGVSVAGAGAVAARWREITLHRRPTEAAGTLITLALVAAFVLPALNASASWVPVVYGWGTFICVFACLGLPAWHGQRPGPRLATAAATGTAVAVKLSPWRHASAYWPYPFWLLLACAAGLLVLGLVGSWGVRIERPSVSEVGIIAGSVVLLVSLFLPWQSYCDAGCSSQRGWATADFAGVFALGLLVALVWTGRVVRELAIGAAIFVLSAGVVTATADTLPSTPPPVVSFRYGAAIGFAGAGLLVVIGLGRFRPIPDKRFLVRLVPVLAGLALLSFEVSPLLLSEIDFQNETDLFARQSPFVAFWWLGAIAILLTLRLILRWFDRPGGSPEVVLLPLALLALIAFAVIHEAVVTAYSRPLTYGTGASWEGWVAIFLCLLLIACGWVARKGAYPWARTDGSASTTSLATSP